MSNACSDPTVATWRALSRAHTVLAEALEGRLTDEHDLPLLSYEVLAHLEEADEGRLRMQELADVLPLTKSGLTRLVDRMESAGLLSRQGCAEDRRGTFACLTDEGRRALSTAGADHRAVLDQRLASELTDDEVETLRTLLERVSDSSHRIRVS